MAATRSSERLMQELKEARRRITELEESGSGRRRLEEALGDGEQQYRRIIDTAYEGIWVLSEQYLTVFVNRRMADMLGYEPEEILGKRHDFFLFQEDLPDLEEKTARRRRGISEQYERRLRRKDGSILWVHVSASPILEHGGLFTGSFAMFTDITEQKEAERALLRSEAKYRSIFENAVEGMFQSTPEGRLITVNPSMARIFGYESPAEMTSLVTSIGHQLYADSGNRRTFMQLLTTHGIVEGFETQFHRKDGSLLWGSLNVRGVKDSEGMVLYHEGTLEDITARKKAEEGLKESEEKYRTIFENAVEGIFQITADGRYLSVNPSLSRIHGFGSSEEMIRSVTDIAHQLYVDPSRRAGLTRLLEKEGFVKDFEVLMRRKDMSLHWVSVTSHAVRDANGATLYYEGTVEDITSRKLAQEELKQLRKSSSGALHAMSVMVEARDPGTSGHQKRVSSLAKVMAQEMGLTHDMTEGVGMAGLIHDLGKMYVSARILNKAGRLTGTEYAAIRVHPQSGYDILRKADLPYPVAELILQHHERIDGSGYPRHLKGNEILLEARILAVADVVEAMTSSRSYRPALGMDAALEEIQRNRGLLYDAEAVDVCLTLFKEKDFRFV